MSNKIKTVMIVCLSNGHIGEPYVAHELNLGVKRLEEMGLKVKFSTNALKGKQFIKENPQKRAEDLIEAFKDKEVDMILCAIGGDDTYLLTPYLFDNDELKKALSDKIFLGFSDTTWNHFMLHKLGFNSYYGQSFLADICEISPDILPYTKQAFLDLIKDGEVKQIKPSDVWYDSRVDFSVEAMGSTLGSHKNEGFELLQGPAVFEGKIFGGCIDSIYDMFNTKRYPDTVEMINKYQLFPSAKDWQDKILLLESSEEKMSVQKYHDALVYLKNAKVLDNIKGILVGKPSDEYLYEEYKQVLIDVIDNKDLPILYNVNIGHATPRCIIPFGVDCVVDSNSQTITFKNK